MSQCTAKSKQSGERCKRHTAPDRTVCYYHGGKIPRGIALPQTKDGRYSKDLPANLLATYQQTKNDPDILALIDEIAGVDAFSTDLIKQLHTGVSWEAAYDTWMDFKSANLRKDAEGARRALDAHEKIILDGHANDETRDKVYASFDMRRKLVESERKRRIEMHTMVTVDQVALLVRSLTGVIREHVTDPTALRAISDALSAIAVGRTD